MPTYRVTYALAGGREVTEEVQSTGPEVARAVFRERGVFPIEVREIRSGRGRNIRLPVKTTAWILRQLGMLIDAEVSEMDALASMKDHGSASSRQMLQQIHGALSVARVSFSAALVDFPKVLPAHLRAIIAAGEGSGRSGMAERMRDVADWLLFQDRIKRTVRRATAYPAFLFVLGGAYLVFFVVWFVPRFKLLLDGFNVPLPAYSVAVLGAVDWFRAHLVPVAVVAGVAIFTASYFRKVDQFALAFDRALLRLPIVARVYRALFTTLFARNYRALMLSGAFNDDALGLCIEMFANRAAKAELRRVRREIKDSGATLGTALRRTAFLPPEAVAAIATAETTGKLPEVLKLLADQYEEEANDAVSAALTWLAPMLLLVLGVLIGGILLALFLPMAEFFKYV